MPLKPSRTARRLCTIVIAIAVINFLAFVLVAAAIGGDAVNGHAEAGKFFLASHGKLTETTESVFRYSRLHVYSLWITHLLGMIAAWLRWKWRGQG
jgi:hypothetical protein